MPLTTADFNQVFNITPSWHVQTIQNGNKGTHPSKRHQKHHQLQQEIQKCHLSLKEFLVLLNSTDFNQILNIASSEHIQIIKNVIKDTSPNQDVHNCDRLQPQLQQCHLSLRVNLMPSNSSDFNQILNRAPSGYVLSIHDVINDNSTSQEHHNDHHLQQELQKCHQSFKESFIPLN